MIWPKLFSFFSEFRAVLSREARGLHCGGFALVSNRENWGCFLFLHMSLSKYDTLAVIIGGNVDNLKLGRALVTLKLMASGPFDSQIILKPGYRPFFSPSPLLHWGNKVNGIVQA